MADRYIGSHFVLKLFCNTSRNMSHVSIPSWSTVFVNPAIAAFGANDQVHFSSTSSSFRALPSLICHIIAIKHDVFIHKQFRVLKTLRGLRFRFVQCPFKMPEKQNIFDPNNYSHFLSYITGFIRFGSTIPSKYVQVVINAEQKLKTK